MTFRIEWSKPSIAKLIYWWNGAGNARREEIMDAVDLVERVLSTFPDRAGESREPGVRVLVMQPLAVSYRLNLRQGTVRIFHVHCRRPKG